MSKTENADSCLKFIIERIGIHVISGWGTLYGDKMWVLYVTLN